MPNSAFERTVGQDGQRLAAVRALRPAKLKVVRASAEELALHSAQVEGIDKASGGKCVWKQLELIAVELKAVGTA